jgi:hypothetical protein
LGRVRKRGWERKARKVDGVLRIEEVWLFVRDG